MPALTSALASPVPDVARAAVPALRGRHRGHGGLPGGAVRVARLAEALERLDRHRPGPSGRGVLPLPLRIDPPAAGDHRRHGAAGRRTWPFDRLAHAFQDSRAVVLYQACSVPDRSTVILGEGRPDTALCPRDGLEADPRCATGRGARPPAPAASSLHHRLQFRPLLLAASVWRPAADRGAVGQGAHDLLGGGGRRGATSRSLQEGAAAGDRGRPGRPGVLGALPRCRHRLRRAFAHDEPVS